MLNYGQRSANQAIASIGAAEGAVIKKIGVGAHRHLKTIGTWAYGIATKVLTAVAPKTIQLLIRRPSLTNRSSGQSSAAAELKRRAYSRGAMETPTMQQDNDASEPDYIDGLDMVVPGIRDRVSIVFTIGNELAKESDRGCALVVVAFLENEITSLLELFLVKQGRKAAEALFDFNGPLGTFSSKIKMAYALGLIPLDIQNALDLVRRLRNDFAHLHKPLDFESPQIKQRVLQLLPGHQEASSSPRTIFISKIQSIAATIHLCMANTYRRDAPVYEPVPMREDAAEDLLQIAALRIMKITSPEITYEQALDMARKIKTIK